MAREPLPFIARSTGSLKEPTSHSEPLSGELPRLGPELLIRRGGGASEVGNAETQSREVSGTWFLVRLSWVSKKLELQQHEVISIWGRSPVSGSVLPGWLHR
jgi:hypothetical protein